MFTTCVSESRDTRHPATTPTATRIHSATPPAAVPPKLPVGETSPDNDYFSQQISSPLTPTAQEVQLEPDDVFTWPIFRQLVDVGRVDQWRRDIPPNADGDTHGSKKFSHETKLQEGIDVTFTASPDSKTSCPLWSDNSQVRSWDAGFGCDTWITINSRPETVQYPAGQPVSENAGRETEAAYSSTSE